MNQPLPVINLPPPMPIFSIWNCGLPPTTAPKVELANFSQRAVSRWKATSSNEPQNKQTTNHEVIPHSQFYITVTLAL